MYIEHTHEAHVLPYLQKSGSIAPSSDVHQVPSLTELTLRVIAKHFAGKSFSWGRFALRHHPTHADFPNIDGLDPKFVLAITSSLRTDLDPAVTGPHVNDEHYWERVCRDEMKWLTCDIAEHGLSWKQLFFERFLAQRLETFGSNEGLSHEFEVASVRPPIDSTHPDWDMLYPQVPKSRPDGRPTRERFCKFGSNCDAVRIARAPNSGWPALENLKKYVIPASERFADSFAWHHLSEDERRLRPATPPAEEPAGDEDEQGQSQDAAAPAPAAPKRTGPAADGGASLVSGALAVPKELDASLREGIPEWEDGGAEEAECDNNTLREFLLPEEVEIFQATGVLPLQRHPCLICTRALQLSRLVKHLEAGEDCTFSLSVGQLLSHLDWEIVFSRLPNLAAVTATYGVRGVGMRYNRALMGMKVTDAMSLAKCLKATQTLTYLSLPRNLIDDDLLRLLITGMIHNQTVTHLDLSHNKITEFGVRLLTRLLGSDSVIMTLDLGDNQIRSEGGAYIGAALTENESLVELNLKLNRLQDEGGQALLSALLGNNTLTSLNLAHNQLGSSSAAALISCLQGAASPLITLDVAGNELNEGDADGILSALDDNVCLTSLDLRGNSGIPADCSALKHIEKVTRRNELDLRRIMKDPLQ